MLRAILRKGDIVPLKPLPSDWKEGDELEIDVARTSKPSESFDIDGWARTMDQLCADSSTDDEELMHRAIDELRMKAKAQARREMGLTA